MKSIVSSVSRVFVRAAMFTGFVAVALFAIGVMLVTWPVMKRPKGTRKMVVVGELLSSAAVVAMVFFKTPDA